MNDPNAGIAIGLGVFALAIGLRLSFTGLASDRMRYETFLQAQASVLSCRSNNPAGADRLCGPVPSYADFRPPN
jgi:hypothetical protein